MRQDEKTDLVSFLLSERPRIHGPNGGLDWAIEPTVLRWLSANITPGMSTVETGCGYSTLVFAKFGERHTVISPLQSEHEAILKMMEEWGIPKSRVRFICKKSDEALPFIDDNFDAVLIDGWHGFPGPVLDWWYTAKMLNVSGYMIIDDTDIRGVNTLCQFLSKDDQSWQLVADLYKTKIFQLIGNETLGAEWNAQPYGSRKILRPLKVIRRTAGHAYRKLRMRKRD